MEYDYSRLVPVGKPFTHKGRFGLKAKCTDCEETIESSAINKQQAWYGIRKLFRIHVDRKHNA